MAGFGKFSNPEPSEDQQKAFDEAASITMNPAIAAFICALTSLVADDGYMNAVYNKQWGSIVFTPLAVWLCFLLGWAVVTAILSAVLSQKWFQRIAKWQNWICVGVVVLVFAVAIYARTI